jgi:hypothetical protein
LLDDGKGERRWPLDLFTAWKCLEMTQSGHGPAI